MQKKMLCISKDLLNFVHGRLKIFHMYNSDMIFRKKRCFWPISTGFCISEHKKFVYVQTGCRQGQSVNTDSALKITRKITRTGRPPPLAGASLYTTTITPPSLA